MTKPKRVILLVVDILTLLSGIVALIVFAVFTFTKTGVPPSMLSRQEIDAASVTALRTEVTLGNDHITFLSGTLSEWAYLFLFSGTVMFIGSLLHFFLTPWRMDGVKK